MPEEKKLVVINEGKDEKIAGIMEELLDATIQQKLYERAKSYVKGFFAPGAVNEFYKMKAEHPDWNSFVVHKDDSGVIVAKTPNPGIFKRGGGFDYKAAIAYLDENNLAEKAKEAKAIYETKPTLRARFAKSIGDTIDQKWEASKAQYDVMKEAPMAAQVAYYASICKKASFYDDRKDILTKTAAKEIVQSEAYKNDPNAVFAYKDVIRCTIAPGERKIGKKKFAEIAGQDKLAEFTKPAKEPETQPDLTKPIIMFYTPESYEKHLNAVKEIMDKKAKETQEPVVQEAAPKAAPKEEPSEEEFSGGFGDMDDGFADWNER